MSKELTNVQKAILEYIIGCRRGTGITPSLADIALRFGYKNRSTVREHLTAIEKKGYIKRESRLSRSIELIAERELFTSQPVLGEVAAGNPLTIYPDSIDMVDIPSLVRMPPESFLLKVKGDSLRDAYIFSGDIVIVNPNMIPVNGQIVAALLDDGAIVKKFFRHDDFIELISENPDYKPIVIDKNRSSFKVIGVVIGVYRNMAKN